MQKQAQLSPCKVEGLNCEVTHFTAVFNPHFNAHYALGTNFVLYQFHRSDTGNYQAVEIPLKQAPKTSITSAYLVPTNTGFDIFTTDHYYVYSGSIDLATNSTLQSF